MTKIHLFESELTNPQSWFATRDTAAFALIDSLRETEHLSGSFQLLESCTNLVCAFRDVILKIYAPSVCGYQTEADFNRELFALQNLVNTDIQVPRILSSGCVHDRYDFYYLVLTRIDIPPATSFIKTCTKRELRKFGEVLLEKISVFASIKADPELSKNRVSDSPMRYERQLKLDALAGSYNPCFVHGDLSGDNVLYDGKRLAIIDFEDWAYTSTTAEYPSTIFELLRGDPESIEAFFSKPLTLDFIDELYHGILYHYNWDYYLEQYRRKGSRSTFSLSSAEMDFRSNLLVQG